MSDGFEITGIDDAVSMLQKLPKEVFDDAKEIFKDSSFLLHRRTTARFTSGPLHVRSGLARRSFQTRLSGTNVKNLVAGVYSGLVGGKPVVYIRTHEYGANIQAKNKYTRVPGGPYLNIPLPTNQTPSGVQKLTAREVFNSGGYLFKSKAGRWLVMSGTSEPLFVLKKFTNIPKRLNFMGLGDRIAVKIPKQLSDLLGKTLGKL